MGLGVEAAETKQTISDYTNVVNTVVTNIVNTSTLDCTAGNVLDLSTGIIPASPPFPPTPGVPNGYPPFPAQSCVFVTSGNVDITQNATGNCNLNAQNTETINNNIQNDIKNATEQWINNNLAAKQGWLTFAFGLEIAQSTSVAQISTDIANDITNNINNTCAAELNAINTANVALCGYFNKDINLTQNSVVTSITSCINNIAISTILNNSVTNSMYQQTNNHFLLQQEGVGSLFSWLRWFIIGGVIIAALIIIGVVLYLIFGGRGGGSQQIEPNAEQQIQRVEMSNLPENEKLLLEKEIIGRSNLSSGQKQTLEEVVDSKAYQLGRERFMRGIQRRFE